MKTLTLVRHAESFRNAKLPWNRGAATLPLTSAGQVAALAFAARWPSAPDIIIQSTCRRSQDSAAPLAARFPSARLLTLPVHEFTFYDYRVGVDLTEEELQVRVRGFWERCDPLEKDGAGAECFVEFIERCRAFDAWVSSSDWDGSAVCFTHGFFMHAVQAIRNGLVMRSSALLRHLHAKQARNDYANLESVKLLREQRPRFDTAIGGSGQHRSLRHASVRLVCKTPGHWCVTDELAGGIEVFNGQLACNEIVRLHGLAVIDTDFLVSQLCYYQPPYGLKLIQHVKHGGRLELKKF